MSSEKLCHYLDIVHLHLSDSFTCTVKCIEFIYDSGIQQNPEHAILKLVFIHITVGNAHK